MVVFLTGYLAVLIASGPAGWAIGGRSRAVWIPVALLALSGMVAYPLLSGRPDLLLAAVPWRALSTVDDTWFIPFAAFFFGIASRQMPRRTTRGALHVLSCALLAIGIATTGWLVSGAQVVVGDERDDDGGVKQTTDYTCGAAASATFLRHHGIERNEREMARAVRVVPHRGTTMLRLYWAMVDEFAPLGRRVELLYRPVLEPGNIPTPCLADVRLDLFVDHVVVVREVRKDVVVIEDPVTGVWQVPMAHARKMWRGPIIALATTPPTPPPAREDVPSAATAPVASPR